MNYARSIDYFTKVNQKKPLPFFLLAKHTVLSTIKKAMTITSTAFSQNQMLPKKYTCDGDDVNPPLTFSLIPENAKSLVLIVDDPDAPTGTFVHWVLFNISPTTTVIKEGNVPPGVESGKNSAGSTAFVGACPPNGTHRYFFKLYALDTLLSLPKNADKKTVEDAMQSHILESAELIGLYSRG